MSKDFAETVYSDSQNTQISNIIIKYDPVTRQLFVGNQKKREIRSYYIADYRSSEPFIAAIAQALHTTEKRDD